MNKPPTAEMMGTVCEKWKVFKTIHFHHRAYQRGTKYGRKDAELVEQSVLTLLETVLEMSSSGEMMLSGPETSFQIIDRTNRISFIFKVDKTTHEILCITFMDALNHAQVSWKRGCVIFDFDKVRDGNSNMNVFDWTKDIRLQVDAVPIHATNFIKY